MEQEEIASIEGELFMLDRKSPHVAVPVQAIRDGKVIATTLSDDSGKYQFINLKSGWYKIRCQVPGEFLYYGENKLKWTVTNSQYCVPVEDEVIIPILEVFVPEGFSPNGDLINDAFEIKGLDNTINELIVTNMLGAVVFREVNYSNTWEGLDLDGTPLPDGTYYYFLDISSPVQQRLSGYIIIKR